MKTIQRNKLSKKDLEAVEKAIKAIGKEEGWEESTDYYLNKFVAAKVGMPKPMQEMPKPMQATAEVVRSVMNKQLTESEKIEEMEFSSEFELTGTALSVTGEFISAYALPDSPFNSTDNEVYESGYLLVLPLSTGDTVKFIVSEALALAMAKHIKSKTRCFVVIEKGTK